MRKREDRGYFFWRALATPLFRFLFRPSFEGLENLPAEGGAVFACNHRHAADPVYIMAATKRPIRFLAKKEVFDSIFGFIFRMTRCLRVDRDHSNPEVMEESIQILKDQGVVGIFPEGTRNRMNHSVVQPTKTGAVRMAMASGMPVIPIGTAGRYLPFGKHLRMVVGKPLFFTKEADVDSCNEQLRQAIQECVNRAKGGNEK